MSTNYLSDNNFESLHSNQLQPQKVTVAEFENNDPALTESVAAALLGIAAGTLRKMRSRKQGPDYFRTETGTVRYLLSAVLAYRARRTVKH